jgi:hypothetical protein
MSTTIGTEIAKRMMAVETITTAPADPGTPMEKTWSAKKGEIKGKGLETYLCPSEMKEYATRGEKQQHYQIDAN